MDCPFSRPEGAPDCWRRQDFILTYREMEIGHSWFPKGGIPITKEVHKPNYINLCISLDTFFANRSQHDKSYHRNKVLELFGKDPLHACEIIDAYGLNE